jgi:hypothetical protein
MKLQESDPATMLAAAMTISLLEIMLIVGLIVAHNWK